MSTLTCVRLFAGLSSVGVLFALLVACCYYFCEVNDSSRVDWYEPPAMTVVIVLGICSMFTLIDCGFTKRPESLYLVSLSEFIERRSDGCDNSKDS